MTRAKLCTKKVYKDKVTGEDKTVWLEIGTLITKDDKKQFIELNMFPNTPVYVFEDKPRDLQPEVKPSGMNTTSIDYPNGEVNVDDIPF